MKAKLSLLLVFVCFLSGCIAIGHFYPVQGPLSAQTPLPVYSAKLTGAFNSGNISVDLGAGQTCKGRWVAGRAEPAPNGPSGGSASPDMPAVWDFVYGPGFYTAHVLGVRLFARALATCANGDTLTVEMYRRDNLGEIHTPIEIRGVAKDNRDNIYKVVI
ncbi:MAG: hypothetical protein WAM91_12160 [Candidatus Acidiferrales bacterium]